MILNSCCKMIYTDPDLFFCFVPAMGRRGERRMSRWEQRTAYAEIRFGFIVEQVMLDDVHNPFCFCKDLLHFLHFCFMFFWDNLRVSCCWIVKLYFEKITDSKNVIILQRRVFHQHVSLIHPKYAVVFLPKQNSGSDLRVQNQS